MAIYKTSLNF